MKRALFVALVTLGCASEPIGPRINTGNVRERQYRAGKYETGLEPVSDGSLWPQNGRGLFADFRAFRIGDLVTIRVEESSQAAGDSSTKTDRASTESTSMPNVLGLASVIQKNYPSIDPTKLLEWMSSSGFKGEGSTSRESKVEGNIAVRVKQVLPNNDLFVEGTKVILINDEEVHIYVSGVIRPEDIDPNNAVSSSMIADAQIEFSGRGVLSDNQKQGWFARLFAKIRPF